MKRSTHLNAPSEALRRVFLPPPHLPCRRISTQPLYKRPPTRPQHPRPLHSTLHPPQPRHQSTSSTITNLRPPPSANNRPFAPKDSRPRDSEIGSRKIYLVDPTDNSLSPPQLLSTLLSTLPLDDRRRPTQYIQQVAPPSFDHPFPICRIVDKAAAREAEDAARKKESEVKKVKVQDKRLEVGWSVSDNDLKHRLVRLREWLGKGWRVEVVFGSKRKSGWGRKREVSAEEAEGVVEKIRRAVAEVEGAREQKNMEGRVGEAAVLYFEGQAKAQTRDGEGLGG